ncbi:MAG: hypothetical protein IKJ05_02085, partial [Oscillospiraceae bacterium]|nr:hypothetical protein [Oscillospiraceae bacterium]
MVKIGLLGHGVVGTGVVEVVKNKADQLLRLTGEQIEVKSVLVRHDYDVDYKEKFVYSFDEILGDEEIYLNEKGERCIRKKDGSIVALLADEEIYINEKGEKCIRKK